MTNEKIRKIYQDALQATARLEEADALDDYEEIAPEEYYRLQDEWLAALNRLIEAITGQPRINAHRACLLVMNPNKFYHLGEYVSALA